MAWELISTNGCGLFAQTTVTAADHKLFSDIWVWPEVIMKGMQFELLGSLNIQLILCTHRKGSNRKKSSWAVEMDHS